MTFEMGQLVQTAGIHHECQNDPVFAFNVRACFERYVKNDWGDLCKDDKQCNDDAVKFGNDRILATYNVPTSGMTTKKIHIITEIDRSVTTVLFADEY